MDRAGHQLFARPALTRDQHPPVGRRHDGDLFAKRKDGSEFPVEIGLNPIATDEGTMVLSAIVDITERKRAEALLRRNEERFRQVVEAAPNAMVMVDKDGLIVLTNAQTEKMFGYAREELLGQPIEIAWAYVYLASDEASYCLGQSISPNGGDVMW